MRCSTERSAVVPLTLSNSLEFLSRPSCSSGCGWPAFRTGSEYECSLFRRYRGHFQLALPRSDLLAMSKGNLCSSAWGNEGSIK